VKCEFVKFAKEANAADKMELGLRLSEFGKRILPQSECCVSYFRCFREGLKIFNYIGIKAIDFVFAELVIDYIVGDKDLHFVTVKVYQVHFVEEIVQLVLKRRSTSAVSHINITFSHKLIMKNNKALLKFSQPTIKNSKIKIICKESNEALISALKFIKSFSVMMEVTLRDNMLIFSPANNDPRNIMVLILYIDKQNVLLENSQALKDLSIEVESNLMLRNVQTQYEFTKLVTIEIMKTKENKEDNQSMSAIIIRDHEVQMLNRYWDQIL
jgi:hypothetical protein